MASNGWYDPPAGSFSGDSIVTSTGICWHPTPWKNWRQPKIVIDRREIRRRFASRLTSTAKHLRGSSGFAPGAFFVCPHGARVISWVQMKLKSLFYHGLTDLKFQHPRFFLKGEELDRGWAKELFYELNDREFETNLGRGKFAPPRNVIRQFLLSRRGRLLVLSWWEEVDGRWFASSLVGAEHKWPEVMVEEAKLHFPTVMARNPDLAQWAVPAVPKADGPVIVLPPKGPTVKREPKPRYRISRRAQRAAAEAPLAKRGIIFPEGPK